MTSPRRYQHAATAGAVLLAAAAITATAHGLYLPACGFAFGVLILTEAALREAGHVRRRQLEAEWARRRALGETPPPLTPCCVLGHASNDQAHSENCTGEHSLMRFLDRIEQQRDSA
ncbi:hypothetical protein EF913_28415 [Streptomyces sp. WAC04189]|uniref:hypothetical protein n=1 Tax=Streptomyces sp. WAC04189 TaxID=2487411 RepID=UPI000FA24383|nr:hypothetical protein [Streptomyces sp. WAC04189]RSR98056.1 hypothetical protein EF913_28415 [Streptomyces sp. WAC04189]